MRPTVAGAPLQAPPWFRPCASPCGRQRTGGPTHGPALLPRWREIHLSHLKMKPGWTARPIRGYALSLIALGLPNLDQNLERYDALRERWSRLDGKGRVILGVVALVLIALPLLWALDRVLLFLFARSYVDEIARVFNLDHHMAQAISLVVWVIAGYFLSRLFSVSAARRRLGLYGLVSLLVADAVLLSVGGKSQFFEASTGKATKCYVLTRSGEVNYLERPGVDPVTGRLCRVYTPEMAERLQAYAQGKRPGRILELDPVFFDLRTGEPITW